MARRGPKAITDEHKAAMATGRIEGRAVKKYLEALERRRPVRGRRRTVGSVEARLAALDGELGACRDAVQRLALVQERLDLARELASLQTTRDGDDLAELEAEFVAVAASYSARRGIGYPAWREVGVPASVLRAAGISRTR